MVPYSLSSVDGNVTSRYDLSVEKELLGLQNRISFFYENVVKSELDYPLSMVGPKYLFLW